MKISKTQLTPAKCALDLGDGSERGLYVNQDYILRKLGRPQAACQSKAGKTGTV